MLVKYRRVDQAAKDNCSQNIFTTLFQLILIITFLNVYY